MSDDKLKPTWIKEVRRWEPEPYGEAVRNRTMSAEEYYMQNKTSHVYDYDRQRPDEMEYLRRNVEELIYQAKRQENAVERIRKLENLVNDQDEKIGQLKAKSEAQSAKIAELERSQKSETW